MKTGGGNLPWRAVYIYREDWERIHEIADANDCKPVDAIHTILKSWIEGGRE